MSLHKEIKYLLELIKNGMYGLHFLGTIDKTTPLHNVHILSGYLGNRWGK